MRLIPLYSSLLLLLGGISTSIAAEEIGIDEALSGFGDSPAPMDRETDMTDDLDSVLDGFGDQSEISSDLDDILGGFSNSEPSPVKSSLPDPFAGLDEMTSSTHSPFQLNGDLTLSSSYNYSHQPPANGAATDYRGLSSLKTKLNLEGLWDISGDWRAQITLRGFYDSAYSVNGREQYQDNYLDKYEDEAELGETTLSGNLSRDIDLRIGRQIIVWGVSDSIRVIDILNPLDQRVPGMVDIEDLRLPITATQLNYYLGDWSMSAIAIHEIRFHKNPVFGSDFYPFNVPLPSEEIPNDTEFALAINGRFSGWDLSLHFADIYDDTSYLQPTFTPQGLPTGQAKQQHADITLYGATFTLVQGNWLLKMEAASLDGLIYSTNALPTSPKSRRDLLLGFDYSGWTDITLSLEWAMRKISDYDSAINGEKEKSEQFVVRFQSDHLNQQLTFVALISMFGTRGEDGGIQRYSLSYDLNDGIELSGGVIDYIDGDDARFYSSRNNDRIFIDWKYSF